MNKQFLILFLCLAIVSCSTDSHNNSINSPSEAITDLSTSEAVSVQTSTEAETSEISTYADIDQNPTELVLGETPGRVLTVTLQEAYDLLLTTTEFAGTAVGIAGSVPPQVPAFQIILHSDYAVSLFSQLQHDATIAGQLYALCGLYLADKEKFDTLVPAYQNNLNKVRTFFGCIMDEIEIALLVLSIENGYWPIAFRDCSE